MSSILFYSEQDPYYQFSNFYLAEITVDGITYPSTEYYYQSSKFRGPHASPADLAYAKKILQVNTSNKAYYLAKQVARGGYSAAWYVSKTDKTLLNDLITQSKRDKVQQRSDWDCVKDNVMRKAVWAKFTQHQQLRDLLVTTKDAQIAEASPRDSYWGLGNDGHGKNMLGRILMEIRAFLAGVFPVSPTARSNWVIPEFVLASAYPGAPDQNKHQETVDALLGTGVNLILSLQQAHEDQAFNSYRDIVAPGFVPPAESFCEKVYSERYGRPVILMRVPIKDQGIVSDAYLDALTDALISAVGRHYQLLIHCLGGKGRSGTVAAVMLGKMYGMSADEALQVLGTSFEGRVNKGTRKAGMPQSKVQFEQVRRMSAGPKSKLAIVGSRDFTDYQLLTATINKTLRGWGLGYSDLLRIVSGGARGADTLARKFAKEHHIPIMEYRPDWEKHGKAAGIIRNKDIIGDATHVIAFPTSTGRGTQNSMGLAKKAQLPLRVVYIDQPQTTKNPPTVVCIKKDDLKKQGYQDLQDWLDKNDKHMYIGRNMTFYVPGAVGSKWKNPYSVKKYGLVESLKLYEEHVKKSSELMAALPELADKVLGCWCKPAACHGDVLVKLYGEMV